MLKRPVVWLSLLVGCSLVTNFFLGWQWRAERQSLRLLIESKNQQLTLTSLRNRRLTVENQDFQEDLVTKDQKLAETIKELAVKQQELTNLSDQLATRKKELDAKTEELTTAQKQINDQKSQLSVNASELEKLRNRPPLFSFQVKSTQLTDAETKKAAVKQVVTDAYDMIQEVYGKPYLLQSITITFVDQFSNNKAAGEIVITNSDKGLALDIHIKDFNRDSFNDVNTLIHEVVHAFHGLAGLEPTAAEEGITVAVTDAVMERMIAAGTISHFSPLYIRITDSQYAEQSAEIQIPSDADQFYNSDQVASYYQILGKAWYQLYQQDKQFFSKFNEALYAKKRTGQEITDSLVQNTIKEVLPSANLTGGAWQFR